MAIVLISAQHPAIHDILAPPLVAMEHLVIMATQPAELPMVLTIMPIDLIVTTAAFLDACAQALWITPSGAAAPAGRSLIVLGEGPQAAAIPPWYHHVRVPTPRSRTSVLALIQDQLRTFHA